MSIAESYLLQDLQKRVNALEDRVLALERQLREALERKKAK